MQGAPALRAFGEGVGHRLGCGGNTYATLGEEEGGPTSMRWFVPLFMVAGALTTFNAQARGPYGSIIVGNWKGGAYTNDQTGAFTHCTAGSLYKSGIYFMVT